jgi:hypothetical protein
VNRWEEANLGCNGQIGDFHRVGRSFSRFQCRFVQAKVLGRTGISGTDIGQRNGSPRLLVYASDKAVAAKVPGKVDGSRVIIETTGSFSRL